MPLVSIYENSTRVGLTTPQITYYGPEMELSKISLVLLGPSLSKYECKVSTLGGQPGNAFQLEGRPKTSAF